MQLKRVSLLVVFTLFVCSLLFGQVNTTKIKKIEKTAPNTTQTASDSTKKSTRKIVHKKTQRTRSAFSNKYRKTPRVSPNWKMEKLKNREKFANDWINHLQQELSDYKEERAEARKGMKNLIQKDIQEKLEAKEKLAREQQEQLKAREAEIESLKQMQNSIDTTK